MPRRPSAFEVSFPDETPTAQPLPTSTGTKKRHIRSVSDTGTSERPRKQRQLPPVSYYVSEPKKWVEETADLVIPGEILDDLEVEERPIRVITDYVIFDPLHRNEMVSLSSIEEDDGVDRHFEGVGWVSPHFLDEDEGQEDEEDEEDRVYVKLGAILRYTVDYTKENEDFYIETQYAWYILRKPAQAYEDTYRFFYTPRRVAQLVISSALRKSTYNNFLDRYQKMVDIFGRTCQEDDLWDAAIEINRVLEEVANLSTLKSDPLIRKILRRAPSTEAHQPRARGGRSRTLSLAPPVLQSMSDVDFLKAENQFATHVTPRISELIKPYVTEDTVCVIGPRPPPVDKDRAEDQKRQKHRKLRTFINTALSKKRNVDWQKEDQFSPGSDYVRAVTIDDCRFHVGDYVVVSKTDSLMAQVQAAESEPPADARVSDYFWFSRILYFVPSPSQRGKGPYVHVQWLEHGEQIFLQEVAHPQELFLNDLCGNIPIRTIIGKVVVHERPEKLPSIHLEYFYKFKHDKKSSSILSIDFQHSQMVANAMPPENCPNCALTEEHDRAAEPKLLRAGGVVIGLALGGHTFHKYDFVLFKAKQGPAHIGQIKTCGIDTVTVKQVGRINSLENVLPENVRRDERHIYLTDDEESIEHADLIRTIHVLHMQDLADNDLKLEEWLEESPLQFYIKYRFPSMAVDSWSDRKLLNRETMRICATCRTEKLEQSRLLKNFLSNNAGRRMAVLDLFGGVGAFSLGLKEGFPRLQITHTVEISPSPAQTFQRNSPGTVVFNQCANGMLNLAVRKHRGLETPVLKQLRDRTVPVPDPPKPGEIQVITAGFPCQTHSGLNMFKQANDPKSNLIFNALSYVDHYRPDFVYFENVQGFLSYALGTTQASKHRLEGGLKMGGLKLVVRALVDLGYQVRFCLLQAGHYGTPQGRIRFFLIAAREGMPLPELPQPTHEFPQNRGLEIKLTNGETIAPIKTGTGCSFHPFVTIDDAISDLPRFDWEHPRPHSLSPEKQREMRERARDIPAIDCCDRNGWFCGYHGANAPYHHDPKTRYQAQARRRVSRDLQHYTRCLIAKKVERVVSIPLQPNADYRSLPHHLSEWQLVNPVSHVARYNKTGPYGRLDGKGYFPTIVTNVDPTAKQSRVLHPHCRRMVSVRELARAQGFPDDFTFQAYDKRVVTLHRQIGNAVPFPVATALGRELRDAVFKQWLEEQSRG